MADDSQEGAFPEEQGSAGSDLEACPSPSKRPKTLALNPSPISSSKGKEKIEYEKGEETMDSVSDVCGICLSDDGKDIRGWIDSCNHYFCFVCIMEWSKVESLCPMCKQRFSTIRRPPKEGVFLSERIVNVPVRNQVYHPLGNSMIGPSDPYAEVRCTECHSTADENLLLLCDLCDSAAHTYCVGLGVTVPEGDWYCHDCAVSRDDHSNSQTDIDGCNQNFSKSFGTKVAETHVSIFDIVRESDTPEADASPSIVTRRGTCSASRVRETCIAQRDTSAASQVSDATVTQRDTSAASRVRDTSAASRVSDPSARTLGRCRNVQVRIQALRENWNALRSGSVRFSSSLLDSCDKRNTKNSNGAIISERLSLSRSSPSMSSQQITSMDSVSGDTFSSRGSYDIDRAWKMLDIAKSLQRAPKGTHNDHQDSTYPFTKRHSPKEANNITSTFSVPKNKAFTGTDLGNVKIEKSYNCRTSEKEKLMKETIKERVKVNASQKHGGKIEQPCFSGGLTNSKDGTDGSACSITLVNSAPGCSEVSYGRPEFGVSPLSKVGTPKGRGELEKELAEGTTRKDDAKSEVQSLVKLNLKLLNRDKKLGVDGFKEVARLATHTILAACGLEHTKSCVRPFPSSICTHNVQSQQPLMPKLMPSSCRECFYVFVKDVVNSIMAEKIACAGL